MPDASFSAVSDFFFPLLFFKVELFFSVYLIEKKNNVFVNIHWLVCCLIANKIIDRRVTIKMHRSECWFVEGAMLSHHLEYHGVNVLPNHM